MCWSSTQWHEELLLRSIPAPVRIPVTSGRRKAVTLRSLKYGSDTPVPMALPREYTNELCPIARSLEVIGERWTLLIVRDAFYGVVRFTDFQKHLEILLPFSPSVFDCSWTTRS